MRIFLILTIILVGIYSSGQSLNLEWRREPPSVQIIKQTWVAFPKKVPYQDTNGVWHFPITRSNGIPLPTGYYTNRIYLTNELYGLYFTFPVTTNSHIIHSLMMSTNLSTPKWNDVYSWYGKENSEKTLRVYSIHKYYVYDPKDPYGILNGGLITQHTNLEYKPYSIPMFFKMVESCY